MSSKALEQQRAELATALLELLNSDKQLDWKPGWFSNGFGDGDKNAFTGKRYNGINLFATYIVRVTRGYEDNRWLTFNQAKELGGSIKKGEKGIGLIKYTETDLSTKRPPNWKEINAMPMEERLAYIKENVRAFSNRFIVFNVEQCENLNLPKNADLKTMSEAELLKNNALIESVIRNSSAPVLYDGGNRAFYRPATDDIHLPKIEQFKTKQDYYATALHEIAHSTGHESRLNRNLKNMFGTTEYAREELRAEISAMFTQSELGIAIVGEVLESHGAYVEAWREIANIPEELGIVIKEAQKITDYIKENYLPQSATSRAVEQEIAQLEHPTDFETPFTEALLDEHER